LKEKDITINNLKDKNKKLSIKNDQPNIEKNNINEKLNKILFD